jgi:hypothetical protein
MPHSKPTSLIKVPKDVAFTMKCIIKKTKHDTGYNCMVCTATVKGKKFQSSTCTDSIITQVPLNVDAKNENTIQLWTGEHHPAFIINGGATMMMIDKN